MKKLDQINLSENSKSWQSGITDLTKTQLIQILPTKLKKWELIWRNVPWIKWFVTKVLGKKKISHNELTHVETSEGKDFYLYPDGSPVYIKDRNWVNTKYLVSFHSKFVKYKRREIIDWSRPFYADSFEIVETTDDLWNNDAYIYRFSEEKLWERNCLRIWTSNDKISREYITDQETWKILRVWWESILYINDDKKVKIKDRIVQSVDLNTWWSKWIFTDTLEEVKIEWIEENIKEISLWNYNRYDTYLWPYQIMFAETDTWKTYIFDINTMKVLTVPGIDFAINAEKLIDKRFDIDSYASEIKSNEFNIFQKDIFSIPLNIPHLKDTDLPKNIAIYKEDWLPVKVPWTELFVCGFDETYTSDRAKIINWDKYGKAVILDTQEWRNSAIYLREWDLSILEATLLNWEKVMINNILNEENRILSIDWKKIFTVKYNKYRDSTLVDWETFQEVTINVAGTDEKINHVYHHVFTIWWEDVRYVGTTSGKVIYLYKKNLDPLQIPWINGYVEDISELWDWKWNMKVNGKWNVVRVK